METELDFLGDLRRTHTCGQLRAADAGSRALLMGWVHRHRDLGGVIFIHLRDRDGVTQIVIHADADEATHRNAPNRSGPEYVIAVEGPGSAAQRGYRESESGDRRSRTGRGKDLDTERIPHAAFPDGRHRGRRRRSAAEVSLRRSAPSAHAAQYHPAVEDRFRRARDCLNGQGFLEIETPFMTRSTPEGARDYLVPSRVQPGSFYALPQSPQIFKQLLMVTGFDKYFQIVRCFRDEDLRADRQPEFTQIDLEMSFPQEERIFEVIEPLVQRVCQVAGFQVEFPFPRLTYAEAMRSYGSDKPDRRIPPMHPVEHLFPEGSLSAHGLPLVAIRIPEDRRAQPSRAR